MECVKPESKMNVESRPMSDMKAEGSGKPLPIISPLLLVISAPSGGGKTTR